MLPVILLESSKWACPSMVEDVLLTILGSNTLPVLPTLLGVPAGLPVGVVELADECGIAAVALPWPKESVTR